MHQERGEQEERAPKVKSGLDHGVFAADRPRIGGTSACDPRRTLRRDIALPETERALLFTP